MTKKDDENWSAYIFADEANKLERFEAIEQRLSDAQYWELLASLWTNSKTSPSRRKSRMDRWLRLLTAPRGNREHLMQPDDHQKLASLPDPLAIYRGLQEPCRVRGVSWTYDYDRALWFARRFPGRQGKIAHAIAPKSRVLACWADPEAEIVVSPRGLRIRVETKTEK